MSVVFFKSPIPGVLLQTGSSHGFSWKMCEKNTIIGVKTELPGQGDFCREQASALLTAG
jgi:predicted deacylase